MAEVSVEGLDRLFASFDTCIEQVQGAAEKGLERAGMKIIATAQRNMRTAGHNGGTLNNTGRLSQSGRVQKTDNGLEVGFFSNDGGRGYAAVVEYGSKKHWFPPVPDLRAWVHKKLRIDAEHVNSVAFLVGRAIKRRGLPPHPFFTPAVKACQKDVKNAITEAINKVTSK